MPNSQLTLACQGNTTSAKYIIFSIIFLIYNSHMYLFFNIIILNFY